MTTVPVLATLVILANLFPATAVRLTRNETYDGAPQLHAGAVAWSGQAGSDWEIFLRRGAETIQLTDNGFDDHQPQMHGDRIAWLASPPGGDREVFYWNGAEVIQLTDNAFDEDHVSIDGDTVVWQGWDGQDWEIYSSAGTGSTQLTDNARDDRTPAIHEGHVVWVGWDGQDDEIFLFDGVSTTQLTSNARPDVEPRIHRGRVAWLGWDGVDHEVFVATNGRIVQLTDDAEEDSSPRIAHGGVAWLASSPEGNRVQLWDGTEVHPISAGLPPGSDGPPEIDGALVAWPREDGATREIYVWDGSNTIPLTDDAQDDGSPQVHHGQIAWECASEICLWTGAGGRLLSAQPDTVRDTYVGAPVAEIDGGWVTWPGQLAPGPDPNGLEIFLWDGLSIVQVTDDGDADLKPQIHDRTLVWQSGLTTDGEIHLWKGGTIVPLTSNPDLGDLTPDVHRGQVAWDGQVAQPTDYEIFVWDGVTQRQLTDNTVTDLEPQIHDGWVAWHAWPQVDGLDDVFVWNGVTTIQLNGPTNGGSQLRLDSGQVVWAGGQGYEREIYLWDGSETLQLTANHASDWQPDMHRGQIVWTGGPEHGDSEIFLWQAGNVVQLTDDDASQSRPTIWDGEVAWLSSEGGQPYIDLWDGLTVHRLEAGGQQGSLAGLRMNQGQAVWTRHVGSEARIYLASARPHEVRGLRASSPSRFSWNPTVWGTAESYGVVRGSLASLGFTGDEVELGEVDCLDRDGDGLSVTDPEAPAASEGWFYLVRATRLGPFGSSSTGEPRFANQGCP